MAMSAFRLRKMGFCIVIVTEIIRNFARLISQMPDETIKNNQINY